MGNTPPYVVRSGNFACSNVVDGEANGEQYEQRSVSYRADKRNAEVSIKRIKLGRDNKKPNAKFIISIMDNDRASLIGLRHWPYRFEMMVERAEGQHLKVRYAKKCVTHDSIMYGADALAKVGVTVPLVNLYEQDAIKNRKMTTTKDGGIVETSLNPYRVRGRDNQRGLVVIEWKKKVWNQNPYVVTVSHYFASLGETNNNTGFSVVARIRGVDGADAVQVEGPEFHPATALFEMFDKVLRSGCWTPDACPHCTANYANNNNAANAIPRARGETANNAAANAIPRGRGETANNAAIPHARGETAKYRPNQSPIAGLQSNGENSEQNQWFSSLVNFSTLDGRE